MTNVALLGCGMISGAYAPTIAEFDHLDLVACADVDPVRAAEVAERHGIPEVCTIDELLAHADVEVIVNLTPASAHEAVTGAILEAGKAAYSEKPLGVDLTGAQALVDLAAQQGLRLGCAPDTFLGAGLQTAAAAIEAGAIGTPLAATAFVMGAGPRDLAPQPRDLLRAGRRAAVRHGAVLRDRHRPAPRPGRPGRGDDPRRRREADDPRRPAPGRAVRRGRTDPRGGHDRAHVRRHRHAGGQLRRRRHPPPEHRGLRHRGHPVGAGPELLRRPGDDASARRPGVGADRASAGHDHPAAGHRRRRDGVGQPASGGPTGRRAISPSTRWT